MTATSTLEASVGLAASLFGVRLNAAALDATAILSGVRGLADGKDYGRYFAGQNPLLAYLPAAGNLDDLIAQGVALRTAVAAAVSAMLGAAAGGQDAFVDAVTAAVEALRQSFADPADALRVFADLAGFAVTLNPGSDAIGLAIGDLAEDAAVLMRRLSAIALAEASADYVPNSQQDAETVRDLVGDILDTVALEAADRFEDPSFAALDRLRVAVVNDLTGRGASLAPVALRHVPMPLPSLTLAQLFYRDGSRADELLARNDAETPHPGFMPVDLEALVI